MIDDATVSERMPASFVCEVRPQSAKVRWFFDDEELLISDDKYQMTSERGEHRLTVAKTTSKDNGKVSAQVGDVLSNAALLIEGSVRTKYDSFNLAL